MLHRLAAAIGLVAHVIDRFGNWLIGLVGVRVRVPFAALLAIPLIWLSATSAIAGFERLASQAEPEPATIAELVERQDPGAYFTIQGLVHAESMTVESAIIDPDAFVAGASSAHYYLLRDPSDPTAGMVVRSPLDDDRFRRRTLNATVVADPAFVAAALDELGAAADGWRVDSERYLDETVAGSAPEADASAPSVAVADAEAGDTVRVEGSVVSPGNAAACGDPSGSCSEESPRAYLLADPESNGAVLLRSPHQPDAVPVEATGLLLAPNQTVAAEMEGDWLTDERATLRQRPRRIFFDGQVPPFFPPSFAGAIAGGGLAALLLVSTLVGYPRFRRDRGARPPSMPDLDSLDGLQVGATGRVTTTHGDVRITDEVGRFRRMDAREYELTRWRYGDQLGPTPKELIAAAEAAGGEPRLVLDIANASTLLRLWPSEGDIVAMEPGWIEWARRGQPAIRVRGKGVELLLGFRDASDRDRIAALAAAPEAAL
jgi:hypothetical protein